MSHKQSTEHSINHTECGVRYLAQIQQFGSNTGVITRTYHHPQVFC